MAGRLNSILVQWTIFLSLTLTLMVLIAPNQAVLLTELSDEACQPPSSNPECNALCMIARSVAGSCFVGDEDGNMKCFCNDPTGLPPPMMMDGDEDA